MADVNPPQQAAAKLANFANLPPPAQGAAITQQMQQNQQQMQQMHEYNSIARLENSNIRKTDDFMTALRDHTTNANITDFPATPAQLSDISGLVLDQV
ncbi:uncharacterized protein BDZ99DRAFT_564933 [Mytilinidion resinicola]|uniref:Uncharacterized protein n=1 Tax=Mytilinidion resinicola TaxID=574789 RepID=A0A6A6Z800_9PEZI|nr:uncharacterized protein BDZ99DRAFT_564933 [Mytilinidion resinicola]KAF2817140.1 hypothetical protein BDZ99DRAFT_564933 [Mytilinidion resinicola]